MEDDAPRRLPSSPSSIDFTVSSSSFSRIDCELQIPENDLYLLSLPVLSGSDACSKALLRTDAMRDTIIKSVVGNGISGSAYHNAPTEYKDDRRTDITYYPNGNALVKNLIPVVVEIQKTVSHKFIARAMRYCLNIFDDTGLLPIMLVINIDGFSSRQFRNENFTKSDSYPCYKLASTLWAKKALVYNSDSIAKQLQVTPLSNIVADAIKIMTANIELIIFNK